MVKTRTVAVIPARGGSKRLPLKNVVDFFDKPLIAWAIQAAAGSGRFDRILVSTDDAHIAEVARKWGAEVPFLRDQHYDDAAPVSQATIAALDQARDILGEDYDTVVQLMPTCPLRNGRHVTVALDHFIVSGAPFQISCFRFGWMNPWWAARLDREARPTPLFPEMAQRRSQECEPLYCPSGAVWIAEVERLRAAGTFYGEGHIFHPMDWKAAIDIDDNEDLEMAKAVFLMTRQAGTRAHA